MSQTIPAKAGTTSKELRSTRRNYDTETKDN
jgi:hypothetical protein